MLVCNRGDVQSHHGDAGESGGCGKSLRRFLNEVDHD